MDYIYRTKEWKSLDPINRFQLLLVIEGLKPGTTINCMAQNLLEEIILDTELALQRVENSNVFDVANSQKLLDNWNQELKVNQKPFYDFLEIHGLKAGMYLNDKELENEIDQINQRIELNSYGIRGRFYGYPECCIDEYIVDKSNPDTPHKFNIQLEELLDKGELYIPVFDYSPPSFTPCDINCPKAIALLNNYEEIIKRLDPESAEEIVRFNRSNIFQSFCLKV